MVPLLSLLLAVVATAAANSSCHIGVIEEVCVSICQFPSSPLFEHCKNCYPGVCVGVVPASTPAPAASHSSLQMESKSSGYDDPDCLDQEGGLRPVYSSWPDDPVYPCLLYTCRPGGQVTTVDLGLGCDHGEPTNLGNCTRYREAGQCCFNYNCTIPNDRDVNDCVDSSGIPRPHGATWPDNPINTCVTFICRDGQVSVLQDIRPLCPPAPSSPSCIRYRDPDQCCYSYNCSITVGSQPCRDANGQLRPHAAIWYDDDTYPCAKFVCNNGTVVTVVDKRPECPPPPSESGCVAERRPGKCCHSYTCGCLHNGQRYSDGEEFQDNAEHPCKLLRCISGQVGIVTQVSCPTLLCTNQVWPIGQCCRQCAPCVFSGQEYANDETWFDDESRPCVEYRCENGFARVIGNTTCDPAPSPGCTEWYMDKICCPKWDCVDEPCLHNGVSYDHGTTWPEVPTKPCRHLTCNNSAVSVASEHPPCPGPPADNCTPRHVDYQCCPAYDCVTVQCTYLGQTYVENQIWVDDPSFVCKRWRCTRDGPEKILDLTDSCPPLDPPDCPSHRQLGKCCKECIPTQNDPECVDENGVSHPVNSTYFDDPLTQCRLLRCVGSNVTVVVYDRSEHCGTDVTLSNPACYVSGDEDCCPTYICPDCIYEGQEYPPGAKWWDDDERQCTRYMCMPDGTTTIVFTRLPCPDFPAGCVANYRDNQCCHFKYTCMYDPQHNLIPMP